ncbi:MAG: hypothetical protein IKO57_13780 [Treponema sp.]|nr:hypothetical protein [Treponema sp.]
MEETKTKSGLLQRATSVLAEVTPKFDVWAEKNGFKHVGIFVPCTTEKTSSTYYHLLNVFGLSAKTVASSVASSDFWNGKITKTSEWQCFSKDFNELGSFLELFDNKIIDSIDSLYFLPFNDKDMPMICVIAEFIDDEPVTLPNAAESANTLKNMMLVQENTEIKISTLEENIDKGLEISAAHLFILSLKSCVEKSLQSADVERKLSKFDMIDRIEIKEKVIQSVAHTAYAIIEPLFRSPNCIYLGTEGEIKIAMFAKDEPDDQLISFHIATTLRELLGEDVSKQILLLMAGICPNKKGTLMFLQKG